MGSRFPHLVVLFGATGDVAKRKLLPGLGHLATAGFTSSCRIICVSLDDIYAEAIRRHEREALDEFSTRKFSDAA